MSSNDLSLFIGVPEMGTNMASPYKAPATLHTIYHGLVQSHFDYCSVVWGNCAKTLSDKLQRLQNRAVRVLTNTDANKLLKELGWDNLETRRQKLKAEMVYKSLNGLAPNYLSSKFIQE